MKMVRIMMTVVLAVSVVACSSTPVRRSVKEGWRDTMTANKIRYKFMRDDEVKKSHMHVEVFRGVVTLTGRTMTDGEKARAETVAKSVKNVSGVENFIHVVGTADTQVASKAKAAGAVAKTGVVETTLVEDTKTVVKTPAGKAVIKEEVKIAEVEALTDSTPAAPAVKTYTTRTGAGATLAKTPPNKAPKVAAKPTAAPKVATPKVVAPKVAAPKVAPQPEPAPVVVNAEEPAMSPAPKSTVVGKSKTGLPWDGEVYDTDASSMTPAKKPVAETVSRTPVSKPAAEIAKPVPADDLAQEAAQELEKLRKKPLAR